MKKKLASFMCFAMLFSVVLAVSASATEYPNKWVVLHPDQTYAETGTVIGTYKVFDGENDPSSSRGVILEAKCSDGNGFVVDKSYTLGIGSSIAEAYTSFKNDDYFWKTSLDPVGNNTKGCVAETHIWYDM